MAEQIPCPVCEAPNDAWNEVCEVCGADLHAEAPVDDDAEDFEQAQQAQADEGFDLYEDDADDAADAEPAAFEEEHKETVEFSLDEATAADGFGPDDAGPDAFAANTDAADDAEADFDEDELAAGYGFEVEASEATDEADSLDEWSEDTDESVEQPEAFDEADEWEADEDLIADGGEPLEMAEASDPDALAESSEPQTDAFGDPSSEAFGDEQVEDQEFGQDEFGQDEFGQDEFGQDEFAPDSDAEFGDNMAADSDADFDEFAESPEQAEEAAESEVDEEPPPPPELEAILNPERIDREAIAPLPTPGPYAELATLRVFKGGEQLGEIAVDFECTVLGLEAPEAASTEHTAKVTHEDLQDFDNFEAVDDAADEAGAEAVEEADFELEPIEEEPFEEESFQEEQADEAAFELEEIDEDAVESADAETGGEIDAFEEDSEPEEAVEAPQTYEDPENLDEGPVIDLSQFGEATAFARRHGYVFRQNKNYTLYVLSDKGTQLNDELLEIGQHRKLEDGDVIILGGEVALQFNEPAA